MQNNKKNKRLPMPEQVKRGFLAAPDTLDLRDEEGRAVWTQDAYAFLNKDAPDTANPSLWRNTQLNHIYGLFEVTDGIYQVRGYDIANITFVRSEHGWIVMDCGSSRYTAEEALKLFRSEMGDGLVELVNPVITNASGTQCGREGCLSLPGRQGIVTRPDKVTVQAQDRKGRPFEMEAEGFFARAVCHELDHLDGVLYIDKMDRELTPEEIEGHVPEDDLPAEEGDQE